MVEKNLKAAFHTLGCKLNFSETSAIGKVLYERGVTRAARGDSPDIIIVNTCSVTETADKKGRQLIRRLAGGDNGCDWMLCPAETGRGCSS